MPSRVTLIPVAGEVPHAQGNHHPSLAPDAGPYPLAQRDTVQVAVGSDGLWQAFAPLVGINPADTLFADNAVRGQTAGGR